jgi:Ser/Thr protein kinase RdoA (MazF antagonist)
MAITAGEVREQTARGEGALGKAESGEPVFVLRAQDQHAADLVEKWAIWVSLTEQGQAKAQEARVISELMRRWPIHKPPD